MLRIFATIAILGLSTTLAQAGDTLTTRIHEAAALACAPERASVSGPASHYAAIYDQCVTRISNTATARYRAEAKAAAGRKLANNQAPKCPGADRMSEIRPPSDIMSRPFSERR